MKIYHFDITIYEDNDEFWEDLQGKTGCDEVKEVMASMLSNLGFNENNSNVVLRKFEDKEEI